MADRASSRRSTWAVRELVAALPISPSPWKCSCEDQCVEQREHVSSCHLNLDAYSGQCRLCHFGSRSDGSMACPPHPRHFTGLAGSSLLKYSSCAQFVSSSSYGILGKRIPLSLNFDNHTPNSGLHVGHNTHEKDTSQTETFPDSTPPTDLVIPQSALRMFWHVRKRNRWLCLSFFAYSALLECPLVGTCLRWWASGLAASSDVVFSGLELVFGCNRNLVVPSVAFQLPQIPRLHLRARALASFSGMLFASMAVGAALPLLYSQVTHPSACVWRNSVPLNPYDALLPCLLAASSNATGNASVIRRLNLTINATALWTQKEFDSTLGFPGEGPPKQFRSAGELVTGENWRDGTSGPHSRGSNNTAYNPLDDVPASITVRNTFVEVPESSSSRLLRPTVSEPSAPISIAAAAASSSNANASDIDDVSAGLRDASLTNTTRPSATSSTRVYCPVEGCPDSFPERVAGWSSHQSMRAHLNEHAAGRCVGSVPRTYLDEHRLDQCQVCSKLLARRFGGTCPRCRPQLAREVNDSAQSQRPYDGPSFDEIFGKRVPTKAFVPKAARKLWAQCLLAAIAQVLEFNDELAWAELFILPKCVLRTSKRGGKKHRKRSDVETKTLRAPTSEIPTG